MTFKKKPIISIEELCLIVETALLSATGKSSLSTQVDINSDMKSHDDWDSLSFIFVFSAVGESLGLELDEDDAFHFTSIKSIHSFLCEIGEQ